MEFIGCIGLKGFIGSLEVIGDDLGFFWEQVESHFNMTCWKRRLQLYPKPDTLNPIP